MAFSTTGSSPSHPEMNVPPLIDVLLVLIIVFMIVVSQEKRKGLDAQIPQPPQGQDQPSPERTVVIQLAAAAKDEPPTLTINQESVRWEDLKARLQGIFKIRAERVAFVRGEDEIDFQYVANLIDIARSAGVERVGLLDNLSPSGGVQ